MFDPSTTVEALISRVRNLQAFLSDPEIATIIVEAGDASPEDVFLACMAARVLDAE